MTYIVLESDLFRQVRFEKKEQGDRYLFVNPKHIFEGRLVCCWFSFDEILRILDEEGLGYRVSECGRSTYYQSCGCAEIRRVPHDPVYYSDRKVGIIDDRCPYCDHGRQTGGYQYEKIFCQFHSCIAEDYLAKKYSQIIKKYDLHDDRGTR